MLHNRHDSMAGHDSAHRREPVFVDRTGRRRHLAILAGLGIGAGLLVSLALIIAGLVGGASAPLPGWPASGSQRHGEGGVADLSRIAPDGSDNPATTSTTAPVGASGGTTSAQPSPSPTQQLATPRPGQGDDHRRTPDGKPSRSPGKPR
jgi:hypothetical protein